MRRITLSQLEESMGIRHIKLMRDAMRKHPGKKITIPGTCQTLTECFVCENGRLKFWYNVPIENGKETTCLVVERDDDRKVVAS